MRLAQLAGFAPEAVKHVTNIIKAIPDPETAKELIRGLADRCLDILLKHVFPTGKLSPASVAEWTRDYKIDPKKNQEMCAGNVPRNRGQRMRLLDLLFEEQSGFPDVYGREDGSRCRGRPRRFCCAGIAQTSAKVRCG